VLTEYQKSEVLKKTQKGMDHPDTARSLHDLAKLYHAQGKFDEAEPLDKRALAIREKVILSIYICYSNNFILTLYEQKVFGKFHVEIARSLHNLGELYFAKSRYSQAKALYRRSIAILEEALGSNHLKVAVGLQGLAKLYYKIGKYEEGNFVPL